MKKVSQLRLLNFALEQNNPEFKIEKKIKDYNLKLKNMFLNKNEIFKSFSHWADGYLENIEIDIDSQIIRCVDRKNKMSIKVEYSMDNECKFYFYTICDIARHIIRDVPQINKDDYKRLNKNNLI